MPLNMMKIGETLEIRKIKGKDETSKFLSNLGFVEGARITLVSLFSGNMIVNIKDTRIAIDRSMANRVIV